ncbi:MAG: serine/threonine protein kinase, partial [Planctomycetaceae bacterium]|nr:serine/threonine protein kinase [Planctomycetaceae bacterium]
MSDAQNKVGTYELKNCIASGKTTQIWEVTENGTLSFAMKLMLEDARKKPEEKAILKHEFKVGKSFDHPSVIRFHKIEVSRDHAFFIMDFFRAPSMKVQIATNLPDVQSRFARIAESICTAMTHVHEKGWLHRDIKPENILVNKTGETRVVDFSLASKIAKGLGKLVGGKSKIIQGTRTYIAPEVIMRKHVDERTDIYSLGVTLFELATGVPPFAGLDPNDLLKKHLSEAPAPPSAINSNVTPELDQVLLKMIAKKPSDRYADMREVQTALKAVRCFKEDPAELYGRSIREAKEQETLSVDKRLDSRADADRTAMGVAAPAKPTKGKRKTAAIGKLDPVVKKGAPAGHPGQQQPGMPQPMMAPPMMMPPMMMPQPMMMP